MMDALNCLKGAFYIVTNSYISENLKKKKYCPFDLSIHQESCNNIKWFSQKKKSKKKSSTTVFIVDNNNN